MKGVLAGYKVYLLAWAAITGAVVGYLVGELTAMEAAEIAWTGGLAGAFRAAIEKLN